MSGSDFLYHTACPHCGSSDAYSVFTDGHGFCFSCEAHDQEAVSEGEGGNSSKTTQEKAPQEKTETPRKTQKVSSFIIGEARQLTKRGISEQTCKKFSYVIGNDGTHGPVQIAAYYSMTRKLEAQHIRTASKDFYWIGKPSLLFGQHLWNERGKRLVITEGEIDCLSIAEAQDCKWPTVSIPSGAKSAKKYITANIDFVESFNEVVLAFDDDTEGKRAVEDIIGILSPGKVLVMSYNGYKDANELLLNEGKASVVSAIYNAKLFRPDGIIMGEDLWEIIKTSPCAGYDIPYPKLNAMIQGMRKAELTLFTAGSGIGKSTVVNEVAYHHMMHNDLKIGVVALEESKKVTAERYLGLHLNKRLSVSRDGVSADSLRTAWKATIGQKGKFCLYDHWGSLHSDLLIGKLRYMIKALGMDFIVLDHISIVVSGLSDASGDERKTLDILMTKLRSLVQETGAGIIAVSHLKRTDKDFNAGGRVSLKDLRGSASLEQLSDIVIGLERNQQSEETSNQVRIRVLKNRPIGIVGLADTLEYDSETGRLYPATESPSAFRREEDNTDF